MRVSGRGIFLGSDIIIWWQCEKTNTQIIHTYNLSRELLELYPSATRKTRVMRIFMSGSSFGKIFRITTWGESHGSGIGVVIDGCPSGIQLNEGLIQDYLNRRKAAATPFSTPRTENDFVAIHSGVFNGVTTGTPIALSVTNSGIMYNSYSELADLYRPGHADYTFDRKYGVRDYRGGGRSSGRETVARVAAGAVATAILKKLGITFCTYVSSIGPIKISYSNSSLDNLASSSLNMPDDEATKRAEEYLMEIKNAGDTAGGVVECLVSGMPAGIGEPVFDKLDANLAKAVMSIGSVKGFEIGSGFEASTIKGSENNDLFYKDENGNISKKTNNAGGILGGISDGSEIVLRAAFKPVPSVALKQSTVDKNGKTKELEIPKTNDICIVPRACVIVEAMTAITLVDMLFENMSSKIDSVVNFYNKSGYLL